MSKMDILSDEILLYIIIIDLIFSKILFSSKIALSNNTIVRREVKLASLSSDI